MLRVYHSNRLDVLEALMELLSNANGWTILSNRR